MILAPWRSPVARALHRNRALPAARYLQLATVRGNGLPANRTIVFRGFVAEPFNKGDQFGNSLQFITDRRSEKIPELQQNPAAEACWYFPKTREQFRLSGSVELVMAAGGTAPANPLEALRVQLWQSISDSARSQFTWPYPAKARAEQEAFELDPPDSRRPLEDFAALLLTPDQVDHLELRGEPQSRTRYWLDPHGQWLTESVNP
ncbi:MAG: Npun_F5749 family FMN-dependent PPOX-type flavoprotein [Pseudomonadota bacterium]